MKNAKKIISIIIIIILLPVLFINGVILINSIVHPNKIPSFFGWKPFIILSGSMETEIYPGDIAIFKEINPDNLKENDIIAFRSGDIIITHRIIEIIEENGEIKYLTKGDNNNTSDKDYVSQNDVEGIYKFKISNLGNLAIFVQTPVGMISCLSIPILLLVILNIIENSKNKKYINEKMNKQEEMQQEIERLKKQNKELKDNQTK